jgi:hypothetical protein
VTIVFVAVSDTQQEVSYKFEKAAKLEQAAFFCVKNQKMEQ